MSAPLSHLSCPVCRADVTARDRAESDCFPFCSPRCRLIDLGRWLGGQYRLPGPRVDPGDGGAAANQMSQERPN